MNRALLRNPVTIGILALVAVILIASTVTIVPETQQAVVVRFGEPGLASAMATMYLLVMLAVAVVAVATIWRPGSES